MARNSAQDTAVQETAFEVAPEPVTEGTEASAVDTDTPEEPKAETPFIEWVGSLVKRTRNGKSNDVLLDEGRLLVREAKTGKRYVLTVTEVNSFTS